MALASRTPDTQTSDAQTQGTQTPGTQTPDPHELTRLDGDPASSRPGPRFHDVHSADGTRLRAWDNGVEGPTVLLCNGLGTNPYAWPGLLDRDCGVRVISWMHRGTGGSERPARRSAAGIDEFVQDALAVLDAYGVDCAPTIGWSMGVNTAFELALRHPQRVSGILAVAGVPGATFSTMLAPLRLPPLAAEALTVGIARGLLPTGPLLSTLAGWLPIGERVVGTLSRSGLMLPMADPAMAVAAIREFLTTPLDWYFHMALCAARHRRVPLSRIRVPTTFLAGSWDLLAGPRAMRSAAERLPEGRYVEIRSTHFLPMEQPGAVQDELVELLATVG